MEQLRNEHPLVRTILEHRKLTKLHSTYLEGLRPLINTVTGRIHTHFQQLVTVTGRLSSTEGRVFEMELWRARLQGAAATSRIVWLLAGGALTGIILEVFRTV